MRIIKKGATSQSIYVVILDSTSTTGGRKTGLVFNTSSLTAYYTLNQGTATAITLATLAAANSAYSSGGFKEVDATNQPGVYRLDVPNAALTGADSVVITLKGATGMVQVDEEIQLVGVDLMDAVRGGMTALPNANAEAAGGLYTRGSGAGQINQPANGQIDANMVKVSGTAQTARDLGASVLLSSGTGTGQISLSSGAVLLQATQTGVTIPTVTTLTNAPSDSSGVTTLLSRVPSGIFTGITSLAQWLGLIAGKQTGNSTARTEIRATGAGSGTFDETTDSIEALRDRGDAAWVTGSAAPSAATVAAAVWDETLASHLTSGSTGAALNAAGAAGDPWSTSLPGAYGAGTAGNIIGNRLDAAVTSRLAPTTAGRTLDVTATGEAGIDWGNIGSPTTSQNLSGTTISTSQAVASVSGAVGSVTGNVGGNVTGSIGSLATQAKADVNAEVDSALDTAIPGSPTANSINERIQTMDNAYTAARAANLDNLDATISSRLAAASITLTGGQVSIDAASKTGLRLSATGLSDISATILTTALTESYASDGAAPTLSQAIFAIQQMMQERSISTTTMTIKKLDGSTTAMTFTLDDANSPTSITRAS